MIIECSRRKFLSSAHTGAAAVVLWGTGVVDAADGQSTDNSPTNDLAPEFPRQAASEVQGVVGASHFDLDRVTQLVTNRPALAKASWDWGFGDWESALGAASHVGRPDIAEVLIAHGARPDVFTLAMFGKVDAVRAMVLANPGLQRIPGPHGITLLQHARNRLQSDNISSEDRSDVGQVVDYLESLGDADQTAASLELSETQQKSYEGTYRFGDGADDVLIVQIKRGRLFLQRADQAARAINLVEPHAFAPAGAAAVRIRFEIVEGRATTLTVHDPVPLVKAIRIVT